MNQIYLHKILFIVLLQLFVVSASQCTYSAQNFEKDKNLTIIVKTIPYINGIIDTANSYISKKSEIDKNGNATSILEFSKTGDLLESETMEYDNKGKLIRIEKKNNITALIYDNFGRLIEQTETDRLINKSVISKKTWSYDNNNNIIEEKTVNSNDQLSWWVVSDYDNLILIRKRGLHPDMTTWWTEEYNYNQNGQKIRIDYLDNTGLTFKQVAWSYDKNSDTTLYEEYNQTGAETSRQVNSFSARNILSKSELYDASGKIVSVKNFDPNGSLIEETVFDTDGSIFRQKKFEHDTENRKIKETEIYKTETTEVKEYFYLNRNNE